MASLRVAREKLEMVRGIRTKLSKELGWEQQDERWLERAGTFLKEKAKSFKSLQKRQQQTDETFSISTWKRFFQGKSVRVETFHAICKALDIAWQDVVDSSCLSLDSGTTSENFFKEEFPEVQKTNLSSKVIAIFPFQHSEKGKLDNVLVDGFCDGIIRRLSRLNGLRIISTESTRALFKPELPVPEIGRQLQAHMIVVGSIREFGDRLNLTVKLIDVQSGVTTWISDDDDTYEFGYDELAKAQRDVIRSIAEELAVHLTSTDQHALERGIAIHPIAYEHYVRASGLYTTNRQQDLENVLLLLDEAISVDGKFADAYALKGYALWRKYFSGWNADINSLKQAVSVTQKALKLNPLSVTARMSLIRIYWDLGKFEDALELGKEVIHLAPGSNEAVIAMARAYNNAGMADCSLPLVQRVLKTDPTNPTASKLLIWNYLMVGEYLEACKVAESYFRRNPEDANTSWAGVAAYAHLGAFQEAIDIAQLGLRANPHDFTLWCLYGYLYKLKGDETESLKVWRSGAEMLSGVLPKKNYRARIWLALIYAAMGSCDDAREEASRVESTNSENGYLLYRLANVYSELESFDQALIALEKAINLGFRSVQMMRCEELVYMSKLSTQTKYQKLVKSLESRVEKLRKQFQVSRSD